MVTNGIRAITLDDVKGFHAALGVVARERRFLRLTDAPPLERTRKFVANNIETKNPHLVALHDDRVVGWCDISRDVGMATHVGGLGIGLLPEYRGHGIGRALMLKTLEMARASGFLRVELEVYASNENAIALYEQLGFEHEGRKRAAVKIGADYVDVLMMALLFEPS